MNIQARVAELAARSRNTTLSAAEWWESAAHLRALGRHDEASRAEHLARQAADHTTQPTRAQATPAAAPPPPTQAVQGRPEAVRPAPSSNAGTVAGVFVLFIIGLALGGPVLVNVIVASLVALAAQSLGVDYLESISVGALLTVPLQILAALIMARWRERTSEQIAVAIIGMAFLFMLWLGLMTTAFGPPTR